MSTSTPIRIIDPSQVGLEQCYFEQSSPFSNEFLFFSPGNDAQPIQLGVPFSFTIEELKLSWTVTLMAYTDFTDHGYGTWSVKNLESEDDPETGTFQAQGGPGAGDDLEASASASA